MRETGSGTIAIADIAEDCVEAIIEDIYTGDTKHADDTAMLVLAADKFELKGLLDFCLRNISYS